MPTERKANWTELQAPLLESDGGDAADPLPQKIHHGNDDLPPRVIQLPRGPQIKTYRNRHPNAVSTAAYRWWNFLPLNLYEQFKKSANWYFLLLCVLVCFPSISPYNTPYATVLPFVFVVALNMLKDGYVDYLRHQDDARVNRTPVTVLRGERFQMVQCWDLRVGDIVRVDESESIPADILILATEMSLSNFSGNDEPIGGLCYVDTAELDGETNLKLYQGLAETSAYSTPERCGQLWCKLTCDAPNGTIGDWRGRIQFSSGEPISVSERQLLLRGSKLRNTDTVWGLVVYTGHQTKIILNSQAAGSIKHSKCEQTMNRQLVFVFCAMALACSVNATGCAVWISEHRGTAWYLYLGGEFQADLSEHWYGTTSNFPVWVLAFFTSIVLFSLMVPLSLYVTVEFIKFVLGMFIGWDIELFSYRLNQHAKCRNENIIEDIGQVEYLLSDKTGTLTMNQMALLSLSINGLAYGQEPPPGRERDPVVPFYDPRVSNGRWVALPERDVIEHFLQALALCNTVLPDHTESGEVRYSAASPDDSALAYACHELGVSLQSREWRRDGADQVMLEVADKVSSFTILKTLDFTSERKRMSVLVEDQSGRIQLITKGADNVVLERLAEQSSPLVESTLEQADAFASLGLRVLLVAESAALDKQMIVDWLARYVAAESLVSRFERDQAIRGLEDELETGLTLLGATAIEDKLQPDVEITLDRLRRANIKAWVLTGDKLETAVKIGFASKLLSDSMTLIQMTAYDRETKRELGPDALMERLESAWLRATDGRTALEMALVMEGRALEALGIGATADEWRLWPPEHRDRLQNLRARCISICCECRAVLVCRASPKQKGDIAALVRARGKVVAAVGDGANDVGMIQVANVGVGIMGVEGSQAVNNSDFALPEFRHLSGLLLVHGRLAYKRLAQSICYFFYKNFAAIFPVIIYIFYTGFSGTQLYNDTAISGWNVVFTAFPVLAFALLEQDVSRKLALEHPQVYRAGQEDRFLNTWLFLSWMAEAFFDAVIVWVLIWSGAVLNLDTNGRQIGEAMLGVFCFTTVLLIVTFRLAIETRWWTWIHLVCYIVSPALWFVFLMFESLSPTGILADGTMYWIIFYMLRWPGFYLAVILATTTAILPALARKIYVTTYHPTETETVRREMLEAQRLERQHQEAVSSTAMPQRPSQLFSELASTTEHEDGTNPSAWDVIKGDSSLTPRNKLRAAMHATRFIDRLQKDANAAPKSDS